MSDRARGTRPLPVAQEMWRSATRHTDLLAQREVPLEHAPPAGALSCVVCRAAQGADCKEITDTLTKL